MRILQLFLAQSVLALALAAPTATPTTRTISPREASSAPSISTAAPTGEFTVTEHITIHGVTNSYVTDPGKTIAIAKPTCIQTITPDKNGYVPPGTCNAIWQYYPSFDAAIAFAILFAIITAIHVFQAIRYRKTWCWVIIMASFWETAAFTFRAISSKHQQSSGIYLVFQIFILLAPLWINAFAYMTLGRMVNFFLPSRKVAGIPASTLTALFVGLDVVSFIVQLIGGTMAAPYSPLAQQQKAIHIYMGGIGMQELFILIFICLCIVFQREASQIHATSHGLQSQGFIRSLGLSWRILLFAMYFSLTMITIRIIYRLIEFSGGMGQNNVLTTHEPYFYALESVPMFLAIFTFNIIHPGRIMTGPESDMPSFFSTIKSMCVNRKTHVKLADEDSFDLN